MTKKSSTERHQRGIPAVVQQVKDPALSLQWFGLLLWHRFDPWLENFHMPRAWPKKKKREGGRPEKKKWKKSPVTSSKKVCQAH